MDSRIFAGLILTSFIVGVIVYFFVISPLLTKETPKITLQEAEKCPIWDNFTSSEKILLSYKNESFRIDVCGLSSQGETSNYISQIILFMEQNGIQLTNISFDGLNGFKYNPFKCSSCTSFENGLIIQKNENAIFCVGYSENIAYTEDVCKWYVGEYLK